jgi:hypothetical protein
LGDKRTSQLTARMSANDPKADINRAKPLPVGRVEPLRYFRSEERPE